MPLRTLLVQMFLWVMATVLLILMAALVYGHVGGGERGLSLVRNFISEYETTAPHWPWLVVATFAFSVTLIMLSFGFLMQVRRSPPSVLGCTLLAAASMALFFAAYAPMRRVEQPPNGYKWWTPCWWFTSQTSHTPYEEGMADAYSDIHYHAIRLVIVNGLSGIFLLAVGQLSQPTWRGFSWLTLISSVAMAILFLMGEHIEGQHGLWQRVGFAVMYAWLWLAYGQLSFSAAASEPKT